MPKMKAYKTFSDWADDQCDDWQEPIKILRRIRQTVKK